MRQNQRPLVGRQQSSHRLAVKVQPVETNYSQLAVIAGKVGLDVLEGIDAQSLARVQVLLAAAAGCATAITRGGT